MKKALPIFITEFVISLIFAFTTNGSVFSYDFFTMLGLGNLIIGLLSFILSLIIYFVDKETGKPWFIASGLILLAGCLTCTAFPIRINGGH
jgi:hypothetical protein